jgi:predicted nucleic acid-binding protein
VFDRLVVNASPLIFLSRAQALDWIARLSGRSVCIPQAVVAEVAAGPGGDEIINILRQDVRFEIWPDAPVTPLVAAWDLGPGESRVLAQCQLELGATAVLDDRLARECARSLNIGIIGTLGIVLAAKRHTWIDRVRPVIEGLVQQGMFLSPDLMAAVFREVGE